MHWCSNALVQQCTGVAMHWYSNALVQQCTDAAMCWAPLGCSHYSRPHTLQWAKKHTCWSSYNEGLLTSYSKENKGGWKSTCTPDLRPHLIHSFWFSLPDCNSFSAVFVLAASCFSLSWKKYILWKSGLILWMILWEQSWKALILVTATEISTV